MTCCKKKVLITGASGYIGSNVCKELLDNNYEIHAITHSRNINNNNIITYNVDLFDKSAVLGFFNKNKFDKMIHLAWYVGPKCQTSLINIECLESSLYLIKSFYENGGKTLLVSGSMSEYDFSYGWCKENITPLYSPSLYGQTKASLYQTLEKFSKFHDLNLKWARVFNIYGLNEKKSRLVPYVINAMLNNEDVNVSHCKQIQNYLHISDVAKALVMFLESSYCGAVNIASDTPVRLKDIVELCKSEIKYKKKINYGAIEASFEQMFLSGDNSILKNKIGWRETISLKEGIRSTVEWWKNNG